MMVTKRRLVAPLITLIGTGLLAIGACALALPGFATQFYGVEVDSAGARTYVRATAARDVAIGVWLLALVALRVRRRVLGASILAVTVIPVCDFLIVATAGEPRYPWILAVHGSSIVALGAFGWWLLKDEGE